ncbi:unnamed protein product [Umbelopsis vinacea]
MTTIKIPNHSNENIVGILESRPEAAVEGQPPRLILIAHGVMGHKNYLFQKLMAQKLPYENFRFDFRGNGDSEGTTGFGNIDDDVQDIRTVASYFEGKGYQIYAIIGHSRGSVASLRYASTCRVPVPHVVNVAGRYRMHLIRGRQSEKQKQEMKEKGYYTWSIRRRGKTEDIRVTDADVKQFASFDTSQVYKLSKATSVLTCHGVADNIVPVHDAAMYSNIIPTHTLKLFPDADHNFKGCYEELVETVLRYFKAHENEAARAWSLGQTKSLHIPRWIDVDGVMNFRDIGGWDIKGGNGYIRERMVFRCGHLSKLTDKGVDTLKSLGITTAFDFRSRQEIEQYGIMREIPGLTRQATPVFLDADYSPEAIAVRWQGYFAGPTGFPHAYRHMLQSGPQVFAGIFKYLISNPRSPFIIHCTAGKDRTGVFVMLLLGLCGVDDEVIAREYELTNLGYWETEEQLARKAQLLERPIEDLKIVMSAPYLAMKETIIMVKREYGSIESYVRNQCGLNDNEIAAIRKIMIVPIRREEKQLYRPSKL